MHKRHTATSRNTFGDTSRAHRDTLKWTQQLINPIATLRNTYIYTEIQPSVQCFTQVHTLRNTCVHTQMTKFTLQNTQVHIHRNTHVHRDTVKCTLSHSQTHAFRTPQVHTETLTEAASQQTGTQRTRSVQGCTHAHTQRHKAP